MDDRFDGYAVNLFLDDDGDWVAHFMEMPNISAFGENPENALHELEAAWKGVKLSYSESNEKPPIAPSRRQYSGQFNVRIDKRIHRALVVEAAKVGISLNALVSKKLAETTPSPI